MFCLGNLNITYVPPIHNISHTHLSFIFPHLVSSTSPQFTSYIQSIYLPLASPSQITSIASLYPSNPSSGSPFNTGPANAETPQFKRLASFQGDFLFQGPRRLFLDVRSGKQPIWSFCESLICYFLSVDYYLRVGVRVLFSE